jgi:FkbM family methyltransferase
MPALFSTRTRVNTAKLFVRLLRALRIDVVCDVGSMNGADALAFRAALPHAAVYAFEANPENARYMQSSPLLRNRSICVVPDAVCDCDGEALFHVVTAEFPIPFWRGMSSLYERSERTDLVSRTVAVKTVRLDTFLANKLEPGSRIALWIDVEGKAFEVLQGAIESIRQALLVHVEVESCACIAPQQRLYPDVKGLLESLGFAPVAASAPPTQAQFNVVFVRRDLLPTEQRLVRRCLMLAVARRVVMRCARQITPRRLLQMHAARVAARRFSC